MKYLLGTLVLEICSMYCIKCMNRGYSIDASAELYSLLSDGVCAGLIDEILSVYELTDDTLAVAHGMAPTNENGSRTFPLVQTLTLQQS